MTVDGLTGMPIATLDVRTLASLGAHIYLNHLVQTMGSSR